MNKLEIMAKLDYANSIVDFDHPRQEIQDVVDALTAMGFREEQVKTQDQLDMEEFMAIGSPEDDGSHIVKVQVPARYLQTGAQAMASTDRAANRAVHDIQGKMIFGVSAPVTFTAGASYKVQL